MKKKYQMLIVIRNDMGETVDTLLGFDSHDDMNAQLGNNEVMYKIIEQSREFAKENNMLVEEITSKEEHEFDKEDTN